MPAGSNSSTGGDIKAVQGDTGHNTAQLVTERYAHILDDDRRVNAERFEDAFYRRKDVGLQASAGPAKETASDKNAELLRLLSQSPEMMALLKAMLNKAK